MRGGLPRSLARRALSIACAVLLLAGARSSLADHAADARSHVAAAQRFERNKDYAGAVRELESALALWPEAKTQLALAAVLHRAGRAEDARVAVRQVERLGPNKELAKASAELQAAIEAQLGMILIEVEPEGATVSIDGVVLGTTPIASRVYKTPGRHAIVVAKAGYVPIEQTVEVTVASTPPFVATLERAPVLVVVRSEPAVSPATVIVDGKERGPLPWAGLLAPGRHVVDASSVNFIFVAREVDVAPSTVPVELVLAAGARKVRLRVSVTPAIALVSVDGQPQGTGSVELTLPLGPRLIRAEAVGFEPRETEVDSSDDDVVVVLNLPRITADVSSSEPAPIPHEVRRGGFTELSAVGLFTADGDPVFDCNQPEITSCGKNAGPHGGGFDMHFGYQTGGRAGALGIDVDLMLLSAAAGMKREATLPTGPESLSFISSLAFLGAGPRYTTPGRRLRGTTALDLGGALRGYISPSSESEPSGNFRLVPAASLSLGCVIGAESGKQFAFGVRSFVELPQRSARSRTEQGAPLVFGTTTTLTVGPYLGVLFGP